jgi:hypothetical protein
MAQSRRSREPDRKGSGEQASDPQRRRLYASMEE